jgi:L-aminopeptidase/D-esterase-like protein
VLSTSTALQQLQDMWARMMEDVHVDNLAAAAAAAAAASALNHVVIRAQGGELLGS